MRPRRFRSTISDIGMEPMVDMVFILLTFFLFTFQVNWLERLHFVESVEAPDAASDTAEERPLKLQLSANATGELLDIQLGGASIKSVQLLEIELRQRREFESRREWRVVVLPDDGLRYEHVIQATTAIDRAGWTPQLTGD